MPGKPLLALCAFIVVLALSFPAYRGWATEDYARETGRECVGCHLDPSGGGELNSVGKAFLAGRAEAGKTHPVSSPFHRGVRFAAGFLHLLTAVMWFGTILYVHLLLKPAYASRGLPRGELIVGWGSIVLIAVTGTILTFYRVPSTDALLHTRFGMLLMAKIGIFLVMTATAFIVTFVIGPRLKARHAKADPQKKDMSMEVLSSFTGKDGSPAYFAYQGMIYNASGSKLWRKGLHVGKHQAGFDLTDVLKLAPHGEDRVFRLPVVGKLLATTEPERKPPHLKAFYFMTFLNLFLVLAVLLIIAVWRWW
ncbi:MAG: cytochrome b5 [Deltaproteobacteria bacterium]|jgi:predicted heme/steroid binding protein|nr:cytochrome b5 [Deltaproteobacteria bacterium]